MSYLFKSCQDFKRTAILCLEQPETANNTRYKRKAKEKLKRLKQFGIGSAEWNIKPLSGFQKSNDLIGENLPHEAEGKQEWTQGEIEMKNSFFDNRCFPPRDIFGDDDRSGTILDHIILW